MDQVLTAKETAKLLKISLPLIYRMAERKQIPCIRWECPGEGTKKPRTMVRFKLADVFQFIEKHYQS